MSISQYLLLLFISATKFAISPFVAINMGFSQQETFIVTTLGGLSGFFLFYYFSSYILRLTGILFAKRQKKKKVFTKKNKLAVKIIREYGLWLLALLTPILLSIPFGAFLCARYFQRKFTIFLVMCSFIILWGFILSFFGDLMFS